MADKTTHEFGTVDYPDVADVKEGVDFNHGAKVGTMIPRKGVVVGDPLAFTGTLDLSTLAIPVDIGVLDLSDFKNITGLNVAGCDFTGLKLNGITGLTSLSLGFRTNLVTLDITGCTGLLALDVQSCSALTMITGLTTCTALSTIDVSGTAMTGVINLTPLTMLTSFIGTSTGITSINVSGLTSLTSLYVQGCASLITLNASGCTSLAGITHSGLSSIVTWNISGCTAYNVALDFSTYITLETVNISGTQVPTLDVGGNTPLTSLNITGCTPLNSLDLGGCTSITVITGLPTCTSLATLDVTNASALTSIDAGGLVNLTTFVHSGLTSIQTINFSGCTSLGNAATLDFNQSLHPYTTLQSVNLTNNLWNSIQCSGCVGLTYLNITGCTPLYGIFVDGCSVLTGIVGMPSCTGLVSANFDGTAVTDIDVSGITTLLNMSIRDCDDLVSLNAAGCSTLYSIDHTYGSFSNFTTLILQNCSAFNDDLGVFTNLVTLDVRGCLVLAGTNDLSALANLSTLLISGASGVTNIDISGTALTTIDFTGTGLHTLTCNVGLVAEITTVGTLTKLTVKDDASTSLDLSGIPTITTLDISNCTSLTSLDASGLAITTLDLTGLTSLTSLTASGCTSLTTLTALSSLTSLVTLDMSGNTGLTALDVSAIPTLTHLLLSGCTGLIGTALAVERSSPYAPYLTMDLENTGAAGVSSGVEEYVGALADGAQENGTANFLGCAELSEVAEGLIEGLISIKGWTIQYTPLP